MAYQYYCPCCPQPNVLEGVETAVGQPVQCPYCHQVFQQPPPQMAGPAQAPAGGYAPAGAMGMPGAMPGGGMPQGGYAPQGYGAPAPGYAPGTPMGPASYDPAAGGYGAPAPGGYGQPMGGPGPEQALDFNRQEATPEIVHIPCPNQQCPYHVQAMEVPSNMMGQDVMCPLCQTAYTLRYEESVEYISRKEEFLRRKEERFAKSALNWAIAAAIVVVLGLLVMMFVMSGGPVQK